MPLALLASVQWREQLDCWNPKAYPELEKRCILIKAEEDSRAGVSTHCTPPGPDACKCLVRNVSKATTTGTRLVSCASSLRSASSFVVPEARHYRSSKSGPRGLWFMFVRYALKIQVATRCHLCFSSIFAAFWKHSAHDICLQVHS